MNFNNSLNHYKHDITGKFKDITSVVSLFDVSTLQDAKNLELFHAVHEVLLKMVQTSRQTILESMGESIELIITDREVRVELPQVVIQGLTLRYLLDSKGLSYFLYLPENPQDLFFTFGKVSALIPFKSVKNEISSPEVYNQLSSVLSKIEEMK